MLVKFGGRGCLVLALVSEDFFPPRVHQTLTEEQRSHSNARLSFFSFGGFFDMFFEKLFQHTVGYPTCRVNGQGNQCIRLELCWLSDSRVDHGNVPVLAKTAECCIFVMHVKRPGHAEVM